MPASTTRRARAKAALCAEGREELFAFCDRHGIAWDRCGKVIVAVDDEEAVRLDALAERARANGIEVHPLDPRGLAEHEPHAAGVAALHVPSTAVVDFPAVCRALADEVQDHGGVVALGRPVTGVERLGTELVVRVGGRGRWDRDRAASRPGGQLCRPGLGPGGPGGR